MTRLEFTFQELDEEFDAIRKVSEKFTQRNSIRVLDQARTLLEGFRSAPPKKMCKWVIPEGDPLLSIPSKGYEKQDKGGHVVFAAISFRWDIEPLGDTSRRSIQNRKFALVGVASTKVRLLEVIDGGLERELGMWRMEIADSNSPGCYFHVQVLGENLEVPFPKSLSVPRFPALVASPPAVIEFVLGELFQEEWQRVSSQETADIMRWKPIQRRRIAALLSWQLLSLDRATGSPWTALKIAQPPADLFTRK